MILINPYSFGNKRDNARVKAIASLTSAGYFARMDKLFVPKGAQNQAKGLEDWKGGTSATLNGSASWSQSDGFVGSLVAGSYVNTNYTPSTDAVNFTANNGGIGGYLTGLTTPSSAVVWGCYGPAAAAFTRSTLFIYQYPTANSFGNTSINGDGGSLDVIASAANTATLGVIQHNRTSNSSHELFMNGVSVGSHSQAGTRTLAARPMYLFEENTGYVHSSASDAKLGAWWAGDVFNSTEQLAIKTILDTYYADVA